LWFDRGCCKVAVVVKTPVYSSLILGEYMVFLLSIVKALGSAFCVVAGRVVVVVIVGGALAGVILPPVAGNRKGHTSWWRYGLLVVLSVGFLYS
jgi:hypothetical protein